MYTLVSTSFGLASVSSSVLRSTFSYAVIDVSVTPSSWKFAEQGSPGHLHLLLALDVVIASVQVVVGVGVAHAVERHAVLVEQGTAIEADALAAVLELPRTAVVLAAVQ